MRPLGSELGFERLYCLILFALANEIIIFKKITTLLYLCMKKACQPLVLRGVGGGFSAKDS